MALFKDIFEANLVESLLERETENTSFPWKDWTCEGFNVWAWGLMILFWFSWSLTSIVYLAKVYRDVFKLFFSFVKIPVWDPKVFIYLISSVAVIATWFCDLKVDIWLLSSSNIWFSTISIFALIFKSLFLTVWLPPNNRGFFVFLSIISSRN